MPEIEGKQFYTPQDLVDMGYGSRSTVMRRILSGDIPSIKDGQRYLVLREDFEQFLLRKKAEQRAEVAARCV